MSIRLISVLLLALSLTACGFHLRGSFVMPDSLDSVSIEGGEADFNEALEARLVRAGSTISSGDDATVVQINNLNYLSSVSKTDALGRATSYTYHYNLDFSVIDGEGNVLQQPTAITQKRTQEYDPNQELQAQQEAEFLKEKMQQDLISQLLRRLSRL